MNFSWCEVRKTSADLVDIADLFYDGKYVGSLFASSNYPGKYFFTRRYVREYFDNFEDCKKAFMNHIKCELGLGIVDYVEMGREEGMVLYEF